MFSLLCLPYKESKEKWEYFILKEGIFIFKIKTLLILGVNIDIHQCTSDTSLSYNEIAHTRKKCCEQQQVKQIQRRFFFR